MKLNRIEHREWTILISDRSSFTCFPPDGEPLHIDSVFCSPEMALAEAMCFVEKITARKQFSNLIDGWLEAGDITIEQHDALDQAIGQMFNIWTSDHLESAQTLPQPQPENLQDS